MTKPDTPDTDDNQVEQEQPFISHLIELRDRLIRVCIVVLVFFVGLYFVRNQLYHMLAEPLLSHLPKGGSLIATEPTGTFIAPLKLALALSVFAAMPYILHQLWSFVAPGLYRHERRMVLPLLVSSVALFYLGMTFAYFVVFPLVFGFFTSVAPQGVAVMTDITKYLNFVLKMFFAFGVAFEVPIATILLVWMGVTTPEGLKAKRPYVIVGVFIIGAVLTPPDIISQSMLAIPMWLLFEAGVFFSKMFVRKDEEEKDNGESEDEHYQPLSDEEMEAELDAAERTESALNEAASEASPPADETPDSAANPQDGPAVADDAANTRPGHHGTEDNGAGDQGPGSEGTDDNTATDPSPGTQAGGEKPDEEPDGSDAGGPAPHKPQH